MENFRQNVTDILGNDNPRINRCRLIAECINKTGNKHAAFTELANMVDSGFYNMVRDEYNWYFGPRKIIF